jgi:predicted outer membrane protein
MKDIYKDMCNDRTGIFCCLIVLMLMAGCSSTLTYDEALQKNENKIEDPQRLEDARFLVEAKSYNILATGLAEAAIKSAYASSMVTLSRQNYEEHEEMGKELKQLARQEDIVLPSSMKEEHQSLLAELTNSDRKDFDKNFIRIHKMISEENNSNFMRMATDAVDEDVRAFAARKLDLFKSHQNALEAVDAELLKTY